MSGVRAVWDLAERAEEEDPFANVVYSAGVSIDLTASEDELAKTFCELLKMEGRLADRGLHCELKDAGQDCLTCGVAVLDRLDQRSRLCRLGKDQAAVEARCNERTAERRAPVLELAARVDEATELGHLDGELVEMLTAAGL